MTELHLTLTDYQSDRRWRWLLQDERGNFIADNDVSLPDDSEYGGFRDPAAYLNYHSAYRNEADSLAQLGAWIGEHIFGDMRPKLAGSFIPPATPIHIHVPPEAQQILFRPLELAHFIDGQPFTEAGLRFIYQITGDTSPARRSTRRPSQSALRLLTVFSLPDQSNPLNLRRERYQLARFVRQLSQTRNVAIELRILQYGATRQTLKEALEAGEGWDVVHLSGHGLRGALLLEDEQGQEDLISADDLAGLLRPSQQRLKLLILDACYTGASHAAARRAIGLSDPTRNQGSTAEYQQHPTVLPSLAQQLVQHLDCAALAMRYPVGDSFATDLMLALYDKLLDKGQPLPAALQLALDSALASERARPSLSPATPLLFGARAANLRLSLPPRPVSFEPLQTGLGIAFPDEPPRLVGRVQPLRRASSALAPDSPLRGVLFYGMPGAGKTACALELAYRHERQRFVGLIWYRAPEEGASGQAPDIGQELFNLMFEIERQLNAPQLALTANLDDPQQWRAYTLPRLSGFLSQNSLLLVLDNLESLLTSSGRWRNPRWEELLAALIEHNGLSRIVLTSRRLPTSLANHPALQREAIHALSFAESVLLARELPHLQDLFADEEGRDLLKRTLRLAQGHPKLLELADGLAADRAELLALLEQAERAMTSDAGALDSFFAPRPRDSDQGETRQTERDFVAALGAWTRGVSRRLSPAAALLFTFLCRLEPPDRMTNILDANWQDFLQRLGDGHPAAPTVRDLPQLGLPPALDELQQVGLIAVETLQTQESNRQSPSNDNPPDAEQLLAILTEQFGDQIANLDPDQLQTLIADLQAQISSSSTSPGQKQISLITIHPGVAEATRAAADPDLLSAADEELGDYWIAGAQHGLRTEMQGGGRLVAQSGRRAAPYLLRRERWVDASNLLEKMIHRDSSPATLALAIPLLRRIIEATERIQAKGILANALMESGRIVEAEQIFQDGVEESIKQGNYRLASSFAGDLLNLLMLSSRFSEALAIAGEMAGYSHLAELGPWTQLGDETRRLQVLNKMGQYEEVLARVAELRPQLDLLPEQSEAQESVNPWNIREALLDTGRSAAMRSEQWAEALALNADQVQYKEARGADAFELARTRFNDYGPLIELDRFGEARALLHACRIVFEGGRHADDLGRVYSALARLENEVGSRETAVNFEKTALRYKYQANNSEGCVISHNNLANYLDPGDAPSALVLAHRLAAAVIRIQTGSGGLRTNLANLAKSDLPPSPPSFAAVAAEVEQIPGVQFRALFDRLPQTYPSGDAAIAAVWGLVEEEKAERERIKSTVESMFPPELLAAFESGDETKVKEIIASLSPDQQQALMAQMSELAEEAGLRLPEESTVPDMQEVLAQWEPLLQSIAAVAQQIEGEIGQEDIEALLPQLAERGWQIATAVRRIWAGERDAATLTADIDPNSAMLINRILAILSS